MELPPPVGAWLLNEGSGLQAWDASGNGNHGTLTGTGVVWGAGSLGSGLVFNNTGGYVLKSGIISSGWPGLSMLIVCDLPAGADQYDTIGGCLGTNAYGIRFWTRDTGKYDATFVTASEYIDMKSPVVLGTGPHSLLVTSDGASVSFYVDGARCAGNAQIALATPTYIKLGANTDAIAGVDRTISGVVNAAYVWNCGLNAAHAKALADPFASRRPSQPWWYAAAGGAGAQTITLAGIASPGALGAIAVSPGAVSAILAGIASGAALGTVVVSSGAVAALLAGIASPGALGAVALTPGTVGIVLDGIAGPEALGAVTLAPGGVAALLDGISAGSVLGSVTLTPGAVSTLLDGIVGPGALGSLTLTPGAAGIALDGVGSSALLGSLTATPGAVTISLDGIPSGAVLGTIRVAIAGVGFVFLPLINRTFTRVGPSMAGRL
jgi:hypothetical protein